MASLFVFAYIYVLLGTRQLASCGRSEPSHVKLGFIGSSVLRIDDRVTICCFAEQWTKPLQSLNFSITPNIDVSRDYVEQRLLPDNRTRLCYNIKIVIEHHLTDAVCEATYYSEPRPVSFVNRTTLKVFKMTFPKMKGPLTFTVGNNWTCEVKVTYDYVSEFVLQWKLDGRNLTENIKGNILTYGYMDDVRKVLPFHKVFTRLTMKTKPAWIVSGARAKLECTAYHVRMGDCPPESAFLNLLVAPSAAVGTDADKSTSVKVKANDTLSHDPSSSKGDEKISMFWFAFTGTIGGLLCVLVTTYIVVRIRRGGGRGGGHADDGGLEGQEHIRSIMEREARAWEEAQKKTLPATSEIPDTLSDLSLESEEVTASTSSYGSATDAFDVGHSPGETQTLTVAKVTDASAREVNQSIIDALTHY